MAANTIRSANTIEIDSQGGPAFALMIAVDFHDLSLAASFCKEIAERFKVQRTLSPPQTTAMLITLIGEMTAAGFADHWTRLTAADPIMSYYMSQMNRADVVHGTPAGQTLDSASLLRTAE